MLFSYVSNDDENDERWTPHTHHLSMNDQACKVLKDSAATLDFTHPSLVGLENYTGECAGIQLVVEQQSVGLPVAKVIKGFLGNLETAAAVSGNLSLQYPHLFANKSNHKFRDVGKQLKQGWFRHSPHQ